MADRIAPIDAVTKLFPKPVMDALTTAVSSAAGRPVQRVVTVKADGTGDYTSPRLANAAIMDATANKPYVIEIHPGIYADDKGEDAADPNAWIVKDHVSLVGTDRNKCIIRWSVPVSATDAQLSAQSALWIRFNTTLANLTIEIEGGQYAVHDEAAGSNPDASRRIKNVSMLHKGYAELNAWRASNGGTPYVGSQNVYGWGSGPGVAGDFEDSSFESPYQTFLMHNNKAFKAPTTAILRRCVLTSHSPVAGGITVNSLGSGTADFLSIIDSQLNFGFIDDVDASWNGDDYADHSDIKMQLSGCNPVGYLNETRGQALRISGGYNDTSTVAGSQVTVSGSAVPVLFGTVHSRPLTTPNLNGQNGFVFGTLDVSGITLQNGQKGRTLGARLGDLRTTPLILQVANQGGYAVAVTLNKDYRTMSNSAVITSLQEGVGGGFAVELYNPSKSEYYPRMLGHESTLINGGPSVIRRFYPVAWTDASRRSVRQMVASDPSSAFVGVAIERIQDGKVGRILHRGFLNNEQLGDFYSPVTAGSSVYFSDDAGRGFTPTGTRLAMTGSANGFAYFRAPAW